MSSEEFKLVSPAIKEINKEGIGKLPRYCTQEGLGSKFDISPPLEWQNVPPKTKSLALLVQDLDAVDPVGRKVQPAHWIVVNIPTAVNRLPEGFSGKKEEVVGMENDEYGVIEEGINDWKVNVWRGPKMPNYGDNFEFRLYALDFDHPFDNQVKKEKLLDAITGHVVGEAVFTATF
ncbi:uncharacterized protein LOC130960321 [Arachis stenosperma]|uniref:uncharacterized protein LOC130960321 n=1 Tax=Arachis stenosperma TaxID=217475 RepID=UPI0025ABADCD|nr:uncharacterized protein LOC130960321 [Arachis stenosperma]